MNSNNTNLLGIKLMSVLSLFCKQTKCLGSICLFICIFSSTLGSLFRFFPLFQIRNSFIFLSSASPFQNISTLLFQLNLKDFSFHEQILRNCVHTWIYSTKYMQVDTLRAYAWQCLRFIDLVLASNVLENKQHFFK